MKTRDAIVVGAGMAGLSASIYLARAQRDVLTVSAGNSMAAWEPNVENYLGFPDGIAGAELISRGRRQAANFGAAFAEDEIDSLVFANDCFTLTSKKNTYRARKVLLATGIFHLPPEIDGVQECLGHSMFFCKDCDGCRVKGKRIAICGHNDEAVEYALGMLQYTGCVLIALHGKKPRWSPQHEVWLRDHQIPVQREKIVEVQHEGCELRGLVFENRDRVAIDALFTTRGDVFYNELAKTAGAEIDDSGEIKTDSCQMTTVPGLYSAGCVTAANCQMIIAAGTGAIAAQAMNRALFEEELRDNRLRLHRAHQIHHERTAPDLVGKAE